LQKNKGEELFSSPYNKLPLPKRTAKKAGK